MSSAGFEGITVCLPPAGPFVSISKREAAKHMWLSSPRLWPWLHLLRQQVRDRKYCGPVFFLMLGCVAVTLYTTSSQKKKSKKSDDYRAGNSVVYLAES
jgi:hypothetical protein